MSRSDTETKVGCFFLVLLIVGSIVVGLLRVASSHTETVTVQDKERVCSGRSDCRYLVWTDQGVYENTDSTFAAKWNSSDVQGRLVKGHTYRVEVRGWRFGPLSWYPNIIEVQGEVNHG